MGKRIRIRVRELSLLAELNDTDTAQAAAKALPLRSRVNRWGEEVYFEIPVKRSLEPGARADVEVGEIGYWPSGAAFCIFFGRTPASSGDKPRAASPVTIIGRTIDDARQLSAAQDDDPITVEEA